MGQLCATASISSNLSQCQILVRKAAAAGAKVSSNSISSLCPLSCFTDWYPQVLFLPEASDYIASSAEESFALAQSTDCRDFLSALQDSAKLERMHINVGIHEVASEHRLKNCLVWIDDKGAIIQNYQKVHLFDVEIQGGPILKEST